MRSTNCALPLLMLATAIAAEFVAAMAINKRDISTNDKCSSNLFISKWYSSSFPGTTKYLHFSSFVFYFAILSVFSVFISLQVTKRRRIVARVQCRNIKNECPKLDCDEPVQLPGKCCKACPGKTNGKDFLCFFFSFKYFESHEFMVMSSGIVFWSPITSMSPDCIGLK